ncbi:Panacea domain-containing protein [Saccharothrix yanglingensis]|uniref:Panacea domain-containing protein n=1 Tax=Saccharothrix yanglingensis TaxID=659496 RepID=UPI0027D31F8C|nr:type II toxin-antitoxin system antitoxin SocA domain-containing protein [Saccharothrix yanglingensis]
MAWRTSTTWPRPCSTPVRVAGEAPPHARAWHLAGHDEPLFDARIEAWWRGPVVPGSYHRHQGRSEPAAPAERERTAVRSVAERYGHFGRRELSDMAHAEEPWRVATCRSPSPAAGRSGTTCRPGTPAG